MYNFAAPIVIENIFDFGQRRYFTAFISSIPTDTVFRHFVHFNSENGGIERMKCRNTGSMTFIPIGIIQHGVKAVKNASLLSIVN